MTSLELYALLGAAVVSVGLHGLVVRPGLLRRILAVNVMSVGVFLIFLSIAARAPGAPDPVPQALVLTGIVVAVSFTGFALVLGGRLVDAEAEPPDEDGG